MVLSLVKGQKIDITKNNPDLSLVHVGLNWQAPSHFDIDVSAFMVGTDGKIVREEDFVFYGQPVSSNGSVRLEESLSTIEKQRFIINLANVPQEVDKIPFTLTIYESEKNDFTFSEVSNIQLRVVNSSRQVEMAVFPIDYTFTQEKAIELGALYRYSGEWKFHAIGAGFFGGLADLCKIYGIDVEDQEIQEQTTDSHSMPEDRFRIVQEPEQTVQGEAIPKPPADYYNKLKRTNTIQFDESRIEELEQQSHTLIDLFNQQDTLVSQDQVAATPHDATSQSLTLTPIQATQTPAALLLGEETSQDDLKAVVHDLDQTELSFLLELNHGEILLTEAKAFLKPHGLMVALFINGINEKAFRHLGDPILEQHPESIVLLEEYEELIPLIKERTTHEH